MNRILMNNKELLQATSRASGRTQKELKEVLEEFEDVILQQLSVATPDTPVEVKVFPCGISLVCEYSSPRVGRNPKTGEEIPIPSKKHIRSKISKNIRDDINQ